jgi:nicotinamide-nucleotide amidase
MTNAETKLKWEFGMNAEIISIGAELTSGQNVDTNSQWLSQRLAEIGIAVRFHATVGDDLKDIVAALRTAQARADLVIVTGGLGPTQDDLTREALAAAAGVELVLHEESLAAIRQMFAARKRPMPERNVAQAWLPHGAEAIPNHLGTAPGIWLESSSIPQAEEPNPRAVLLIALPGVPSEMHAMFREWVRPRLIERLGGAPFVIIERKLNCFGAGESMMEEKLLDLTKRGHEPQVGITVRDAIIALRIRARAASETEARRLIAPVEDTIRQRLGHYVFGVDREELHEVVARLLMEKKQTVAVAESLTGGLVTHLLTLVPGVSASLLGGIVAYANSAKENLLGVPRDLLESHGAVSAPVAEAMAVGVRQRFGADWAVSTTGIAGPTGATATKPVGLVYIGIAGRTGVRSYEVNWFGERHEIQTRSAWSALNALRLHIEGRPA